MKRSALNKSLYCQFLLASQNNFTGTQYSELTNTSHDGVTRWLQNTKLTPNLLFSHVKPLIQKGGVLIVDDSLIAKPFSRSKNSQLLSYQYSGAHHKIMRGIGLVNLVWMNPAGSVIPVDYRIFSKKTDGLTKHQHLRDMVTLALHRGLSPKAVVFDSWYASVKNLKFLERNKLIWVTTLRGNRIVDFGEHLEEKNIPVSGLVVHLKAYGFIKVFKTFSQAKGEVEYIATNNLDSISSDVISVAARRWKIEEYHRGLKQTTGIERCQARDPRSQRTHIFCAIYAFVALEVKRIRNGISWYASKKEIIQDAMRYYLEKPSISLDYY